jgi:hypothetical protein
MVLSAAALGDHRAPSHYREWNASTIREHGHTRVYDVIGNFG